MSIPTPIYNSVTAQRTSLRNISKGLAALYQNCLKDWYPGSTLAGTVQSDGNNVPDNMAALVADALAKVTIAADNIDQFYEGYVVPNS